MYAVTREITAVLDGLGGTTFSDTTVNASAGVAVGTMVDGGSYLDLPITLPISVPASKRRAVVACEIPPSYAGLGDFLDAAGFGLATTGNDATIRVPKSVFALGPGAGTFVVDVSLRLTVI